MAVTLSDIEVRERLMVATLCSDPESYSSPKQLRKATRQELRNEGMDADHTLVSLAFWRLLGRKVLVATDGWKLELAPDAFEDPIWQDPVDSNQAPSVLPAV